MLAFTLFRNRKTVFGENFCCLSGRCFVQSNASWVGQLLDWFLPTSEVRGSNPVIGKIYITNLQSAVLKKRK